MVKRQQLVLKLWFVLLPIICTLSNSTLKNQPATSKIERDDINPGFISIDCGVKEDYTDTNTGIWYQSDADFVETGTIHALSPAENIDNPYFGTQLSTLRSFPEGKRNCYTLKPKQGKNSGYFIRAFFAYGNYDMINQPPTFDLYVGVYHWDTIHVSSGYFYSEINYAPSTDIITVCLVNIGLGVPFISSLELRPLNNSLYQTLPISLPQYLESRHGFGIDSNFTHVRYKDDVYDRIWNTQDFGGVIPISGTVDVHTQNRNDAYNLPAQVLTTAVQPLNGSNTLQIYRSYDNPYQYYVYLHFFEFEQLQQGQKRVINVTIDDDYTHSVSITLGYLKALTLSLNKTMKGYTNVSISSAAESDLPPILNGYEVYGIIPQSNSPTDIGDFNAILEIKHMYEISRIDWQGDPCTPLNLAWTGLICSSGNFPRIITVNLSSSNLSGEIAISFFNLTRLEHLDLSNNNLTGLLPEFLAELQNLKTLDLSGNKLKGPVPKALQEKLKSKTLDLSVDGNPGLGLRGSCKKKKFVIPLVSSIATAVIIAFFSLMIWRHKRKRQGEERSLQIKARAYSYSEIHRITDNFKTIIGEGGFGKVYLGTQHDGTQVAVKLLTLLSKHGFKAYQSEVELLTFLHHRNLVCLVGYCNKGDVKALIYEYMDNGNLHQKLSENSPNVLKWIERLHIAVDAAQGLDYLHNGCRPPIIHRDLKTSNILLSSKMQAKIADFGLSRAFANDNDIRLITAHAGTPGYLDPQYQISKKSDIYSFGIILFELITGQPAIKRTSEGVAIEMRHWVIPEIENGDVQNIIDKRLEAKFNMASVLKAINIATTCISVSAVPRPDISQVLTLLKECLALEMESTTSEMDSIHFESEITEVYPR